MPTERIDWPPPYKDATEKYSSQVADDAGPSQPRWLCRRRAVPDRRCERSRRRHQGDVERRVQADLQRRVRSAMVRLRQRVLGQERAVSRNHRYRSRTLCRLQRSRAHRSRSDADRSRLQGNRPLLSRAPVSGARTAGPWNRIDQVPLRRSEYRGRQLDLDARRPPRPPPELRHSRLGHRTAGLRPESLRRLQRQERELRLEIARREEDARRDQHRKGARRSMSDRRRREPLP